MKRRCRRLVRMTTGCRPGVVLLEVIVALTVLAISGVSLLALTVQSERAVSAAQDGLREIRAAHAFMESVALWERSDLDRHLGSRAEGPFVLVVDRVAPAIYRATLYDEPTMGHGRRPVLETSLYRRELP